MDAPRDDLVRALMPGLEFRADGDGEDGSLGLLHGYFARFGEWTEIDSIWEGRFMERIQRGAFRKTIEDNRDAVKVLFNHGHDFTVGDRVLGPISDLRERSGGGYYEVPLFDTSYNRDLLPGLRSGVYGASFRFKVEKDRWDDKPARSDHNPDGIPERTLTEVRLYEFGPVTFPAYAGATAGVRSLTDHFRERRGLTAGPRDLALVASSTGDRAADNADRAGAPSGHHSEAAHRHAYLRAIELQRRSA